MDDFIWRSLLGGLGVALVTGPLGCFIVWRRMAYFGDTLAHSALLGVALGFLLDINPNLSIFLVLICIAILLLLLQQQKQLATDTLLGILSHSALALGLVAVAFLHNIRLDLYSYLFGDLLSINYNDLYWIYGGGMISLIGITILWRDLLSITVHEELAQVEGVAVAPIKFLFMLLIAIVIAGAMKIVGILLITSMLVIPPAIARNFAHTPEQMAFLSSGIGGLTVMMGLTLSLYWDTPAGPSVVVAATFLFILSMLSSSSVIR
ncbi:MAG: zinc ABC transporter permease subunit ZnuB [Thiotrichaceae bacterium]